jgi:hypothetical protein
MAVDRTAVQHPFTQDEKLQSIVDLLFISMLPLCDVNAIADHH